MRQIPRLFIDQPLGGQSELRLDGPQAHYLGNVLRLGPGGVVHLFDDQGGEWEATISTIAKRGMVLTIGKHLRPRESVADLWLLTAPIRRQRFEWIVEKATELGVARICPVLTERTQGDRLNRDRLKAHMIEAAEQCGRTALPLLDEARPLSLMLAQWPAERRLVFADEEGGEPMSTLAPSSPAAILIGPEGGFSPAEREAVRVIPNVARLSLGPRILRADTAVVAAIAQFQLLAGY